MLIREEAKWNLLLQSPAPAMGRAAQQTLTALLCIVAAVCMGEDSCPEVKIVGLSGSDKLAVLQGCPGMAGAAGPKGEPGAAGMKGDRGAEGIPGKAGPAGEKGEKGGVGLPGSQGIKGDSGASGKIGERGPPGIPGNAGQAGPKGKRGPAGAPGVKGDKGASGTLGTVGEKELDDIQCKKGAKNCKELLARGNIMSGWYTIYPRDCNAMTVLCDMETDGGGWIVFQRRVDGSVDFYRDWNSYKRGFGSQLSEFWLGNDNIHLLTSLGTNELRVDLSDFENNYQFAIFSSFKITGETEKYKLILGAFVNGTAGDSLTIHNHMPFTTQDRDNDLSSSNCATSYKGAWWYRECHSSNLNGLYLRGAHESNADGVNWKTGKGHKYSYKVSEMKFRPV